MRKLFKYVLPMVLVLALLLAACTPSTPAAQPTPEPTAAAEPPAPANAAPVGDGTYETTGQGMGGPITVSTTIAGGKITAVEVLSHTETAGVSTPALERIPQAIVDNNSIAVDAVTGATMTSNGIFAAVKAAIAEAGLNESDFSATVAQTAAADQNLTADVLIIGAGGSGLAAANVLVREGKDVLVIEKMAMAGGATALSGGGFIGGPSKLQQERGVSGDSADAVVADLIKSGEDNYEPLARLFAENNGVAVDWMYYDLKLALTDDPPAPFPEHQFAREFFMKDGASGITGELLRVYEEVGGKILYNTRATSLTVENGTIAGAVAEGLGGAKITIKADNVLLATGGFGNNDDLLPDSVSEILYYGPDFATGDGLLMAREVGAMTWYMDHVKVYSHGIETAPGKAKISTGNALVTRTTSAIFVDRQGNRMLDENLPFSDLRDKAMEQPDQMVFIFMDQASFAIWRESYPNLLPLADIDKFVAQNGGTPMFANAATIAEAAAIAGVDAAGLQATVDRFNGFVAAGKDEEFGRAELFEIGAGPYYLIEQKLRFASTLGGLKINDSMQVLNEAEEPIAGLYASGEIVGGVQGNDTMPGGNLGWALTSGYLVGLSLAE